MRDGRVNDEGYVNVAAQMGLSGERGTRTLQWLLLIRADKLFLQIIQLIIRTGLPDSEDITTMIMDCQRALISLFFFSGVRSYGIRWSWREGSALGNLLKWRDTPVQ